MIITLEVATSFGKTVPQKPRIRKDFQFLEEDNKKNGSPSNREVLMKGGRFSYGRKNPVRSNYYGLQWSLLSRTEKYLEKKDIYCTGHLCLIPPKHYQVAFIFPLKEFTTRTVKNQAEAVLRWFKQRIGCRNPSQILLMRLGRFFNFLRKYCTLYPMDSSYQKECSTADPKCIIH